MREIGQIAQLQIQTSRLKTGEGAARVYNPEPVRIVDSLVVTSRGVHGTGEDDTPVLDVHHEDHPESRNRGVNSVSIGFTGHYRLMQHAFGEHMTVGCAGENIIIALDERVTEADLGKRLVLRSEHSGETLALYDVMAADPCREFSRFSLDDLNAPPQDIKRALQVLQGGVRGFYGTVEGEQTIVLRPGDVLLAAD